MRLVIAAAVLASAGCSAPLGRDAARDGGRVVIDAEPTGTADAELTLDAAVALDAPLPTLPPAAARPPMPAPDLAHVIAALAAERPELLAASCEDRAFLLEAVRRLRAIDPRWGLDRREGPIGGDVVDYFFGDADPEGSASVYVIDVIARWCPRPGIDEPAAASWIDVSERGGVWTLAGLEGELPPLDAGVPGDGGTPPATMLPLPDASDVVDALAAERPDLLAASCVETGGDNAFLFELVRRLRAIDARWGLNWKRGVFGDMSQDVVDYHFGSGEPEGSTDVYILDVIGGHCGPSPSPAFTDVTEATRAGGTIGRWTLAGRGDL